RETLGFLAFATLPGGAGAATRGCDIEVVEEARSRIEQGRQRERHPGEPLGHGRIVASLVRVRAPSRKRWISVRTAAVQAPKAAIQRMPSYGARSRVSPK